MRWYYKLPLRLRSLFRKTEVECELDDEIQFHLQSQAEDYVKQGMNPEEARHAALRSLGGPAQIKEECRDARKVNFIEDLPQDFRFGFRMLRRSPGFSLLVILCLTLGIGANAAVFSWIEGILLRPFPAVAHQDRLVAVVSTKSVGNKGASASEYDDTSWLDWMDFQRSCTLFDSFIADKIMGTTLSVGDRAERVSGSVVSANYFDALGVHPFLGRGFQPGEDSGRNAHPVTVISYWMWKERFGGDPNILGRVQLLNGMPHTIVGVAPEGFYGTFVGWPIQFWVPASMEETFIPGGYNLEDRAYLWIEGFARLKPGVSIDQAQAEISAVAKRLEGDYLATNRGRGVKLFPLWKTPFNHAGDLFPTLAIVLGVVFFVLLIACANVSNLLLARSLGRRHEMTVRLAVGARRNRLLRQLLTEGLILSILAAAGGLLLAYLSRNLLVVFFPSSSGMVAHLRGELDWRVIAFDTGVCLISTLLFALVPAIQTSKIDLAPALKSESGSVFGGRRKSRVHSSLVLVQMSLSFILLVGAVLLIESMQRIRTADPGFLTHDVLTTTVDLVSAGYDTPRAKNFEDGLLERVRALPGVDSAALARVRPFSYLPYSSAPIAVDGYEPAPDEQPTAEYNEVSPRYFMTMGIPLVSGREFAANDNETAAPVTIVNEKMVAQYWRGENPVGKRLRVNGQWMRVVGVAKTVKYETFGEIAKPFFYIPLRHSFSARVSLNIRTRRDPAMFAAALSRELHAMDANLAPGEIIRMREHIDRTALASQQIAVALLSIFGAVALLLASIGLYAVMSYGVSQSSRELGLRMALGASPSDLLRLVISHGLSITATGLVIGAALAAGLTRLMGSLLYKVSPRDPLAFASAFAALMIISIAACLLPALRAAQTDPLRALRD
jgi:predicted permease